MSGYLRRLAAAAMHPPRAIHAVVGAVYAPHRPAAAPALQEVSESPEAAGDATAPTHGPVGRAAHRHEESPHLTAFEADTFADDSAPLVVERDHEHETLLPRRAEPRESDARGAAASEPDRRAKRLPRSEERASEAPIRVRQQPEATEARLIESHVMDDPTHADAETSPQPLIAIERAAAESSSPRTISSNFRPQSTGVPRLTGPLARAERADGPDEIQIHIGRIEVTAVPPPAAVRPAVRPERRSVNLDEYLKQRRGGNR